MARKGKMPLVSPSKIPTDAEGRKKLAEDLKAQGNERFAKREFAKALQIYDQAIRLVPDAKAERAVLHNNKAACHMKALRYQECVRECTNALQADPELVKARVRRAKAHELMNNYAGALEDYRMINANEASRTDESVKKEKEIAAMAEGKLAAPHQVKSAKASQPRQTKNEIKLVHGDDTRVVAFTGTLSYGQLLDIAKQKFPTVVPFKLTYTDRAGDLVTMTSVTDVAAALEAAMAKALVVDQKGPRLGSGISAKVQLTKVDSEAEVPTPPEPEVRELDRHRKYVEMMEEMQKEKEARQREAHRAAALNKNELVEIDHWLVEITSLLKEHLGINPDDHIALQQEGFDRVMTAMEQSVVSDKAVPVFHEAIDKFKEGAAGCIMQWGIVHSRIAQKHVDDLVNANVDQDKVKAHEKYALAMKEYDEAEKRVVESFQYKPDFYDGAFNLAQIYFDRAKLEAGLLVTNPATSPDAGSDELETAQQLYEKALDRLRAQDAEASMPLFEQAISWFEKALSYLPEEERNTDLTAKKPEEVTFKGQTLVMSGNVMYEVSQVKVATGASDWRPWLERAVEAFKNSGAEQEDIHNALKNHLKKEEVEGLVPAPKEAAKAKGLPALKKK